MNMDMYIVNCVTAVIGIVRVKHTQAHAYQYGLYIISERSSQRSQLSQYSEHSKHLVSQTETSVMLLM